MELMLITLIILGVIGAGLGVYGAWAYITAPADWGYGFRPRSVGSEPDDEKLQLAISVLRAKGTSFGASLADEIERGREKRCETRSD